ncbi:MAG TPA: hypothetical protein DCP90_03325 [Clostridiales bacterium]|nr:MAG: hypothetical protein A2Y22_03070 [Clostridiales bacterium GWD2_32_59]HAN09627.1 hypothetical protein [Clostridiales bacterium]
MLRSLIEKIISEEVHGTEFYTETMLEDLELAVEIINESLELGDCTMLEKISKVSEYIKGNVSMRKNYFKSYNHGENVYRTAYGALMLGEAMCAGYSEAARILLELNGIKTKTLIAKLPEKHKKIMHYVCVAIENESEIIIVDPEREKKCEDKGIDFTSYEDAMIYFEPDTLFVRTKLDNGGTGMVVDEYLEKNIRPMLGFEGLKDLTDESVEHGL